MKQCFKCGETKPLDEFYAHPAMSDGHLGKCKECARSDARQNYRNRKPQYQAYERERLTRPERRKAKRVYEIRHRERYPWKTKARNAVSNAIRDGRLSKPAACESCGSVGGVQAHHPDHNEALAVQWLCIRCHRIADGISVEVNQ